MAPDPGPGYRLLASHEKLMYGDECWWCDRLGWFFSENANRGLPQEPGFFYRRAVR